MKFDQLVKEILEYESDTFSASGFEITKEEAKQVAERCIEWFVNNRMDGVILDEFLFAIREEKAVA